MELSNEKPARVNLCLLPFLFKTTHSFIESTQEHKYNIHMVDYQELIPLPSESHTEFTKRKHRHSAQMSRENKRKRTEQMEQENEMMRTQIEHMNKRLKAVEEQNSRLLELVLSSKDHHHDQVLDKGKKKEEGELVQAMDVLHSAAVLVPQRSPVALKIPSPQTVSKTVQPKIQTLSTFMILKFWTIFYALLLHTCLNSHLHPPTTSTINIILFHIKICQQSSLRSTVLLALNLFRLCHGPTSRNVIPYPKSLKDMEIKLTTSGEEMCTRYLRQITKRFASSNVGTHMAGKRGKRKK